MDVDTVLSAEKTLQQVTGVELRSNTDVTGYEMHVGRTDGPGARRPMLRIGTRVDGALSPDGRVMGCHVHGLFSSDDFRRAFLERLGGKADAALAFEARVESALEALADHCETHLDMPRLLEIARAR